ncbi:MAG: phosphodiester glycosidase family protein [Oscillospiraceae bacterium]|nr:phosphodiester glycosidase family protein [Oscillospiraceae bacterium]
MMILYGPSKSMRDTFVLSMLETSAADFLATSFLPASTIKEIVMKNKISDNKDVTDPSIINISIGSEKPDESGSDETGETNPQTDDFKFNYNNQGICILDIYGKTYHGKLLAIKDPSRVFIGTPAEYGKGLGGETVLNMVKETNSLAGINGGGFYDPGKVSSLDGDIPTGINNSAGIVIKDGKIKYITEGFENEKFDLVGITDENILIVGTMTAKQALDLGMRDCLNFGPTLIVNGVPRRVEGYGSGLNPRSAIGQRLDGAILMLVIDGRQANSVGANYEDIMRIMLEYGAVNAANLDGGQSSMMIYDSKIITTPASLYKPRKIATTFLVKK